MIFKADVQCKAERVGVLSCPYHISTVLNAHNLQFYMYVIDLGLTIEASKSMTWPRIFCLAHVIT